MALRSLRESYDEVQRLKSQVSEAIFGQNDLIDETLCALLAGGHILMTGAPGLAKTTLVRVFAARLGASFGRIQFTPDLLPSDIVGSEILNVEPTSGRRHFEFAKGPVFANLLLADEINRASPRTQSALLEAMQERSVTVGGKGYKLPEPFMVFATQNPFESEGTFPLPEAQLDRFLIHSLVSYPDPEAETRMLSEHAGGRLAGEQHGAGGTDAKKSDVMRPEDLLGLIEKARSLPIDEAILTGVRDLVRSTRPSDDLCPDDQKELIWYGAGPRAGIALVSTCRALALIEGQENVGWRHVRRLVKPVLRHRIRLSAASLREGLTEDQLIDRMVERIEARQKNLVRGIA